MFGEVILGAAALGYVAYKYIRRTIHHRQRLNFNAPDEVLQLSGPARHYELPEPQFDRIPPNALTAQATRNFADPELPGASWFGGIVGGGPLAIRTHAAICPL